LVHNQKSARSGQHPEQQKRHAHDPPFTHVSPAFLPNFPTIPDSFLFGSRLLDIDTGYQAL